MLRLELNEKLLPGDVIRCFCGEAVGETMPAHVGETVERVCRGHSPRCSAAGIIGRVSVAVAPHEPMRPQWSPTLVHVDMPRQEFHLDGELADYAIEDGGLVPTNGEGNDG